MKVSNSAVGISDGGALVKDESGNIIPSGFDGNNNLIISPDLSTALWVYYAESFAENSMADNACDSPTIKSIRKTA